MTESDSIESLRDLIVLLAKPLSEEDISAGWDKRSQEAAIRIAEDAISKIQKGETSDAAYHYIRWLDHMGIFGGPLFARVAKSQQLIPRSQQSA